MARNGANQSTRTGLVYTVARTPDPVAGKDVWSWTAIEFRTGETVWQRPHTQSRTGGSG